MKKSLKVMSVFMSAMLTLGSLGAVSLTAGAQESIGTVTKITSGDFVYTVEDNVATIVDYTGSANALVIPQTIDGRKIVRIGDYALSKKAKLNSVVVPESVESIGSSAFEDSVDLKKVTLPDGVTKIGPSAFYGCSKLTTVNIPAKLEEIDDYTFSGCTQLTDIKLSESVTYVGESAFEGCSNLNSVTLSENTETIGDCAFYECDSLYSINLENVSQIGAGAFVYCSNLDDIDLTNCSLIGENAFSVCQSLINIKFPDSIYSIPQTAFEYTLWEQSAPDGVLYAGDFAYKIIGDFTDSTLTFKDDTYAINDDFLSYNEYVKKINLPDSLTSIGVSAFEGCSALKTVTIPDSCGVQAMAFYDCSSLTDINYNETAVWTAPSAFCNTAWYNSQPDGIVYHGTTACAYKGDFAATETVKDGTTIIVDGLFYGDEVLTSINLPDSVEYIGNMAFEDCINLKKISLPKSLYTLCDETFLGCESLESVELSEVVNIGVSAFAHCTSLKSIVIPESVEFGIDDSAFLNCTSLQKVTVNGNIQQIGSAVFMNCENLKSINIPKSVESIGNDVFEFCNNVTIKCYENSYAHEYAKTNGINYSLIFDEREFGDINNDGKVDVNDVTHLQRYIAGFTDESGAPIIPDSDLGYADITDDGTINSRDVTALQLKIVRTDYNNTPQIEIITTTNFPTRALCADGDYLYCSGNLKQAISKIDISEEAKPVLIKTVGGHEGFYARGMSKGNGYLYVPYRDNASGPKTSQKNDVGGYLDIIRLSDFSLANTITYSRKELTVKGHTLYFGKSHYTATYNNSLLCVTQQIGGWSLYDISSTPENPKLLYEYDCRERAYDSDGTGFEEYQQPTFFSDGEKVYLAIAGYDRDLIRIYDVTTPDSPTLVYSCNIRNLWNGDLKSKSLHTMGIACSYPYIYCTIAPYSNKSNGETMEGVAVVDVSNINEVSVSLFKIPNIYRHQYNKGETSPANITISGNYLFMDNYDKGVSMWNISDPKYPVYIKNIPVNSKVCSVLADNNKLFIGLYNN